ncbi:MAG: hypothetical protein JW816_00675 [Candidatus Buchananbacteria bacterium]|nr:hypothetical protein [Candidatus Buchananbacteria bacterium]
MDKKKISESKQAASSSEDELINKGLSKIYSNQDGSLPDISHLEVNRNSRWRLIFFISALVIFFLSVVAWLGFIIFNPNNQANPNSLSLNIVGPKNIASGDEVEYDLEYENIEKVKLDNLEIIFRYPDGFTFKDSEPQPENNFNSSWKIGDLDKGQKGVIKIRGRLIGEVGSLQSFNVTASFEPENFSSLFKQTYVFNSQITSSILTIDVTGPETVLPEKKAEYTIKYQNTSSDQLQNVKIVAAYPTNFVFQSADPEAYSRQDDARKFNNQWLLATLEPGQEGEIKVTGGYVIDADNTNQEPVDFKTQIGFYDDQTQDFSLQQEKIIQTKVIDHGLDLKLIINGSNQDQPVSFGQDLNYSLVYKNLGQYDLNDISLSVTIDSDLVDWNKLEDKNNGVVDGNKITWDKDQISQLVVVRPLDEGTIDFLIPLKNSSQIDVNKTSLQTVSAAKATIQKIGDIQADGLQVEGDPVSNSINTEVQLKIEGRYFDDDNIAVGNGPLPPVVGQTTNFRIYWSLANSLDPLKNVRVTTVLPDGVDWADKFLVKSGQIAYSVKDHSVTWSIDKIDPNQGFDKNNVWFDVSVTPTKDQVKKLLILTGQTSLIATDQTTNNQINRTGKGITSNLEDDPIGGGRGLVIDIAE